MSFNTLLNDFANYLDFLSHGSQNSYLGYVKRVDSANGGMTLQWLKEAATNDDPLGDLSKKFDDFFSPKQKTSKKNKIKLENRITYFGEICIWF